MLVTLAKNSSVGTGVGQSFVKTFAGVLSGSITKPSQLDPLFWTSASSSFELGVLPFPDYWSVEIDDSSSSTSGSITLSLDSSISFRKNYLNISYNGAQVTMYTGSDLVNGNLVCKTTVGSPYTSLSTLNGGDGVGFIYGPSIASVANTKFYIRFAKRFVHIWSTFRYSISGYLLYTSFLGSEITKNLYDSYSKEATFKLFGINGYGGYLSLVTAISNYYLPLTDTHYVSKSWTGLYNSFLNGTNVMTISKECNTIDGISVLADIVVNRLSDGWLGSNLTEDTGLYLASGGNLFSDSEKHTLGSVNYIAITPISNTAITNAALLANY